MPRTHVHRKETAMNPRIEVAPKPGALAEVEAKDQLVAAARRQSKLVAASVDEAEVMRWIQDVSAIEDGE